MWFGSSYGLTRLDSYQKDSVSFTSYSENKGLPNNTIHGMKEDSRGNLWLSSNTGIIQFNPDSEVFRQYNYRTGLDVFEFSDNAYYQSSVHWFYLFWWDSMEWYGFKKIP